jgi:signal recognition particle receptor subunit beta
VILDGEGVTLKLVYDGPTQAGKSTNLQKLHARAHKDARGRLIIADGRTSSLMDMLPINIGLPGRRVARLRISSAPGSDLLLSARKIVLSGADGVVFVADSSEARRDEVRDAWNRLRSGLAEAGLDPEHVPTVIQFNKRDLPDARANHELMILADRGKEPIVPARATEGEGVLASFLKLVRLVYRELDGPHREVRLGLNLGVPEDVFMREIAAVFGAVPPAE